MWTTSTSSSKNVSTSRYVPSRPPTVLSRRLLGCWPLFLPTANVPVLCVQIYTADVERCLLFEEERVSLLFGEDLHNHIATMEDFRRVHKVGRAELVDAIALQNAKQWSLESAKQALIKYGSLEKVVEDATSSAKPSRLQQRLCEAFDEVWGHRERLISERREAFGADEMAGFATPFSDEVLRSIRVGADALPQEETLEKKRKNARRSPPAPEPSGGSEEDAAQRWLRGAGRELIIVDTEAMASMWVGGGGSARSEANVLFLLQLVCQYALDNDASVAMAFGTDERAKNDATW